MPTTTEAYRGLALTGVQLADDGWQVEIAAIGSSGAPSYITQSYSSLTSAFESARRLVDRGVVRAPHPSKCKPAGNR
jgi:hypothetical protein